MVESFRFNGAGHGAVGIAGVGASARDCRCRSKGWDPKLAQQNDPKSLSP